METFLENLGLTKLEAKLYLVLLKIGESKIGPLIKESSIASSKIYSILNKLEKKGLISYKLIQKTKYFKATEPSQLKILLEEQKNEIVLKEKKLKKLLPELNSLYVKSEDSKVEFFEGIKGLRTAHNILFSKIDESTELIYFYPYEELNEEQNLFYKKLWLDHNHINITSRGISTIESKTSKKFKELIKNDCIRFTSFPLPGTIDIVKDHLLLISWSKTPTAVLISSKEIVKHFKNYFESMWKLSKV